MDSFQRHRQLGAGVATRRRRAPARLSTEAAGGAPLPEQAFEEIAEAATRAAAGEDLLEVDTSTLAATESARRRLHFVARPVATGTQLIVGGTLLRIAQRLVGLVDRLELFLGAGFLADIGMEFSRQPAVGGLDLRLACARLQAERLVVILEVH